MRKIYHHNGQLNWFHTDSIFAVLVCCKSWIGSGLFAASPSRSIHTLLFFVTTDLIERSKINIGTRPRDPCTQFVHGTLKRGIVSSSNQSIDWFISRSIDWWAPVEKRRWRANSAKKEDSSRWGSWPWLITCININCVTDIFLINLSLHLYLVNQFDSKIAH